MKATYPITKNKKGKTIKMWSTCVEVPKVVCDSEQKINNRNLKQYGANLLRLLNTCKTMSSTKSDQHDLDNLLKRFKKLVIKRETLYKEVSMLCSTANKCSTCCSEPACFDNFYGNSTYVRGATPPFLGGACCSQNKGYLPHGDYAHIKLALKLCEAFTQTKNVVIKYINIPYSKNQKSCPVLTPTGCGLPVWWRADQCLWFVCSIVRQYYEQKTGLPAEMVSKLFDTNEYIRKDNSILKEAQGEVTDLVKFYTYLTTGLS